MPRRKRIHVPGLSHHVFQRGANRADVFVDDSDYDHFLQMTAEAAVGQQLQIHAYTLMTNHYHMIVTTKGLESLAQTMATVNGGYAKYFNQKYGRIGPLWNGRYGAALLDTERYWLTCLRYVELNPIRAQMVAAAESYRWSSYRVHACGESSDWLTRHRCYLALGIDDRMRQETYRKMCEIPLTRAEFQLQRRPPRLSPAVALASV